MIRAALAMAAMALLASCPRAGDRAQDVRAPGLETAAVLRGLVGDPAAAGVVGLYARDTDRVCVVRSGSAYRIGAYVDYGEGVGCSGGGALSASGERLSVTLGEGCSFDARFDGDRIVFPAALPDACSGLCTRRASFAALTALRLSDSAAEGAAMRDADGRLPCSAS